MTIVATVSVIIGIGPSLPGRAHPKCNGITNGFDIVCKTTLNEDGEQNRQSAFNAGESLFEMCEKQTISL